MPEHEQSKLERKRRLSAALRENLKRRKAQARGRGAKPHIAETLPERKTNDDSKP